MMNCHSKIDDDGYHLSSTESKNSDASGFDKQRNSMTL